jgi:hypothetical protein
LVHVNRSLASPELYNALPNGATSNRSVSCGRVHSPVLAHSSRYHSPRNPSFAVDESSALASWATQLRVTPIAGIAGEKVIESPIQTTLQL